MTDCCNGQGWVYCFCGGGKTGCADCFGDGFHPCWGCNVKTIKGPKEASVYHLTCKKDECAAVLEVTKADMRFHSDQRDGAAYVLKCPHCQTETWIDVTALEKYAVVKS